MHNHVIVNSVIDMHVTAEVPWYAAVYSVLFCTIINNESQYSDRLGNRRHNS